MNFHFLSSQLIQVSKQDIPLYSLPNDLRTVLLISNLNIVDTVETILNIGGIEN